MGICRGSCEFLIHAQERVTATLGRVLPLGRQQMFIPSKRSRLLSVQRVSCSGREHCSAGCKNDIQSKIYVTGIVARFKQVDV